MKYQKTLKLILITILCFLLLLGTDVQAQEKETLNEDVFFEDFSENVLDSSKWLIANKNWGGTDSVTGMDYNGGVIPENVKVENGTLILTGYGNDYEGDVRGINRDLSLRSDGKRVGAAIATKEYFGSGSYEVRAKIAPELGACSAIWTFEYEEYYPGDEMFDKLANGGSYYAVNHEIDIEMPGRPNSACINQSFNYALCNTWIGEKGNEYTTNYTDIGFAQNDGNYHTYRFDWHTGDDNQVPRVEFYFDGILTKTCYTNIPTNEGRLWLGLWFPKAWAGVPNFDTTTFDVDYVKITPFHEKGDTKQHETYPNDGWAQENIIDNQNSDEEIFAQNLIKNSDFKNGKSDWTISGGTKIQNCQAILASGSDTDTISQKISIDGNKTYRLQAQILSSGAEVEIGVDDYNGRYTNINKKISNNGLVTIDFTTVSHIKEIKIYAQVLRYQHNTENCYITDISLIPLSENSETVISEPVNDNDKIDNNSIKNDEFDLNNQNWTLTGSALIKENKAILSSGNDTDEIMKTINVIPGNTYTLYADIETVGTEVEIGVMDYNGRYTTLNAYTTKTRSCFI